MNQKYTCIGLVSFSLLAGIMSCREHSSPGTTSGRNVSPHEVRFSGIALYSTKEQLSTVFRSLRCPTKDGEMCTWRPGKKDRAYGEIEEITFMFNRNVLSGFHIRYAQVFDVVFRRIDSEVKAQFAPPSGSQAIDTVDCAYTYDSLQVTFSPNRKLHWTGSFYVFTPVLDVREHLVQSGTNEKQEE